eukprot:SAG31_NODE_511_length_14722_cov_14.770499_10_plen_147_part_00
MGSGELVPSGLHPFAVASPRSEELNEGVLALDLDHRVKVGGSQLDRVDGEEHGAEGEERGNELHIEAGVRDRRRGRVGGKEVLGWSWLVWQGRAGWLAPRLARPPPSRTRVLVVNLVRLFVVSVLLNFNIQSSYLGTTATKIGRSY